MTKKTTDKRKTTTKKKTTAKKKSASVRKAGIPIVEELKVEKVIKETEEQAEKIEVDPIKMEEKTTEEVEIQIISPHDLVKELEKDTQKQPHANIVVEGKPGFQIIKCLYNNKEYDLKLKLFRHGEYRYQSQDGKLTLTVRG